MGRDGPEPFCPLPSAEGGGGALGGERARASKPTARSRWPRVTVGGRPPGSRDAGSAWSALWVAAESAEVGPVLGLRAGVRAGWQSGQRLWRAFCACSGWGGGSLSPSPAPSREHLRGEGTPQPGDQGGFPGQPASPSTAPMPVPASHTAWRLLSVWDAGCAGGGTSSLSSPLSPVSPGAWARRGAAETCPRSRRDRRASRPSHVSMLLRGWCPGSPLQAMNCFNS